MKDEEMADKYAEEYFGKKTELVEVWKLKSCKENFLAGLKAGRPQWHDLRENKNLVPDSPRLVLVQCIDSTYCEFSYYFDNSWILNRNVPVIAWCEIPTFDKE
jgi:hypothetical protein